MTSEMGTRIQINKQVIVNELNKFSFLRTEDRSATSNMENIEAKDSLKQVQIIQGFGGKEAKCFAGSGKHNEIRKVV